MAMTDKSKNMRCYTVLVRSYKFLQPHDYTYEVILMKAEGGITQSIWLPCFLHSLLSLRVSNLTPQQCMLLCAPGKCVCLHTCAFITKGRRCTWGGQTVRPHPQPRRFGRRGFTCTLEWHLPGTAEAWRRVSGRVSVPLRFPRVNLEGKLPATITQQGDVMNTFIYKYN